MSKIVLPNYQNSLINLTASIKKHFGKSSEYASIPMLDQKLIGKKHVTVILLDGLGLNILEKNLGKTSFLRKNLLTPITSIFPPTTVAATNAILQGTLPGENGWFGWQQYFKDINKNVVMFSDCDYYTKEKIAPTEREKYTVYHEYGADLQVKYNSLYPAFRKGGFERIEDMLEEAKIINKCEDKSYTYCYWEYPDATIHEYGCYAKETKKKVKELNKAIEKYAKELREYTLTIVIADHGLIDVSPIYLDCYPEVTKYFCHLPSLEGRAMIFNVIDRESFKKAFNTSFSKWFWLLSSEEFLNSKLVFGTIEKIKPFLGDFIAIAIDKYYFTFKGFVDMLGHHAGITEEEMVVPLITF